MGNIAAVALSTASFFLIIVAVLLNSPELFYMSTAMVALVLACRVQAWLSVRQLRFERFAPEIVRAGEEVAIEIRCWSERRIRRPLITIEDKLPKRLHTESRSPSLPIAPSFGQPIATEYRFVPARRGRFRWNELVAVGTDALGLVTMSKLYEANLVELLVLPRPIPISYSIPASMGWGFQETEHGRGRGQGLEPRGVRPYIEGDSMRYVHWKTTARTGQVMVKEFETGAQSSVAFFVQLTRGSEVGVGAKTTLELMSSHIAYMTGQMIRQGIEIQFPGQEHSTDTLLPVEREQATLSLLASLEAESATSFSTTLETFRHEVFPGAAVFVFLSLAEPGLPATLRQVRESGHPVVAVLYNAQAFLEPRQKLMGTSATDPAFVQGLVDAGVQITLATGGAP